MGDMLRNTQKCSYLHEARIRKEIIRNGSAEKLFRQTPKSSTKVTSEGYRGILGINWIEEANEQIDTSCSSSIYRHDTSIFFSDYSALYPSKETDH